MVSFRITKNGFIGNGSGSLTGSLLGTASHAITASSVAWNDVTGKPSTYPAAAHDHTGDHLKPASVTTTGDITVGGNLIVNGSQTVIKTKNLTVKDKLIEIASGSTTQAAANGAGIAIQTASAATQEGREAASARIQYRSSDNHFTASIGFVAPSFTGSLQGTATHAKLAESAEKLSTGNVGGTGEPVYFENGVPVADSKTKGVVDWVTNNSESLSTPDEVIWKKGTGIDSAVQVLTGDNEAFTPTATGQAAVAIGNSTTASGLYSHAEGGGTIASGMISHAEGICTTASGDLSHAEGENTEASGPVSHAEGHGTNASGECSHAEGYGTVASNDNEHAQGQYNHSSKNQIFSVGAGEIMGETVNRRNAISVLAVNNNSKYTSSFFVQNIGGYDGTNPTPGTNDLATVISKLKPNAGTVTSVGVSAGTGITASVTDATTIPKISISSAQAHTHSNKAVLDGITALMTSSWKSKQDAIDDLATIRSNATNGQTAYGWGNHASAGYAKSGDITTAINNLVAASESKWSADTNTKVTSADNHYTPAQVGTSGSSTERYYIKTIGVDSKGHVTSVTTGHETVENTDTKVTAVGNHYTPKQSTAKAASAGSVISGIGLDAAGHVTSITSSNSISNATNATTAINLGVAGNTSASVAAAIAEKWTYSEDTIKGVVVNKAVSATKLVGTSGSVGVPVYINAGVPKACQANLVSLPLSSAEATSGTVTLAPGKVHNCGTLTGNLTIELDASSTDSHEAIYCCVFNMGSTLRTIKLPAGVSVVENSADLDTTNMYYEINIMNNVAIIARTAAS